MSPRTKRIQRIISEYEEASSYTNRLYEVMGIPPGTDFTLEALKSQFEISKALDALETKNKVVSISTLREVNPQKGD